MPSNQQEVSCFNAGDWDGLGEKTGKKSKFQNCWSFTSVRNSICMNLIPRVSRLLIPWMEEERPWEWGRISIVVPHWKTAATGPSLQGTGRWDTLGMRLSLHQYTTLKNINNITIINNKYITNTKLKEESFILLLHDSPRTSNVWSLFLWKTHVFST